MRSVPVPLLAPSVRWAGVLAIAGAIAYLSVLTAPPEDPLLVEPVFFALDKWRHFLAYGVLGGALAYATADWQRPRWALALGVLGVVAGYGLGIEGLQALHPERYFTVGDATANAIGGLVVLPWFALRPYLDLVAVPERTRS